MSKGKVPEKALFGLGLFMFSALYTGLTKIIRM